MKWAPCLAGAGLGVALVLAACGGDQRPAPAHLPPDRADSQPVFAFDCSAPQELVTGLLRACREVRSQQARSAQRSWNALVDFVRGSFWRRTIPSGSHLRRIERIEALERLEWRIIGEREEGPQRTVLVEVRCLNAKPRCTAFPAMIPPAAALARLPLWFARLIIPRGPTHPIRCEWREFLAGGLCERVFWIPLQVHENGGRWELDIPPHLISGLLLEIKNA